MYIPGIGYINTPQDLLQNEWVVFAGVFLLTFTIVFYSIKKFLGSEGDSYFDLASGKQKKHKDDYKIPTVVSAVLAFFTAASFSQYGPFYAYFGAVLSIWNLIFIAIVMVLISLPFFKAVKHAFGSSKVAGAISGLVIGIAYWTLLKGEMFYSSFAYNFSDFSYAGYEFLISGEGLFYMIVFFGVIGIFIPSSKRI